MSERREILIALYQAAVRAAQPAPAVMAALDDLDASAARVRIIAIGKAAEAMAAAAVEWCRREGRIIAGGIVVGADAGGVDSVAGLSRVAGDHPVPDAASSVAAARIGLDVKSAAAGEEIVVLLSGGASSLAGAPIAGVTGADLGRLNELLLGSGLDITAMNQVRKRVLRWGAGRLAAALAPSRVQCLILSDVIGDDIATIGSGPCAPDETTAGEIMSLLRSAGIWDDTPGTVRRLLDDTLAGRVAETPKPGDAAFTHVHARIIANNRTALDGAARHAATLGLDAHVVPEPIRGEAAEVGTALGRGLASERGRCTIRGGETVVSLRDGIRGIGGRCQELALAAAREIAGCGTAGLLAAGTDGRDGPAAAAGAVVDGGTWSRIVAAGRDPATALLKHDAFPALASGSGLLDARATGTNVADVVITLS